MQESFFSKIVDDVDELEGLLPSVQSLLSDTAGALGDVAHEFLTMIGSKEWRDDLVLLGKGNIPIIKNIGGGLNNLWGIFKDLTIIIQPFTEALTKGFKKGTENLAAMVDEARKSGSLNKWLMGDKESGSKGVLGTLRQWWQIIKNIGKTLFNYAKGAEKFATWISDGIQKATEGWLKTSEDAAKKDSPFQKWLENIKPLLTEISRMFGTFFSWFTKESGEPENIKQMTEIFKMLTDDLGPKLAGLFDALSKANIGPKFIGAVTKLVGIITTLADSPATGVFFDTLNFLLDMIQRLLDMPGVGPVLKAAATGFAAIAAVSFVAKFTGLENLIGKLLQFAMGGKSLPGLFSRIKASLSGNWPTPYIPTHAVPGAGANGAPAQPGILTRGGKPRRALPPVGTPQRAIPRVGRLGKLGGLISLIPGLGKLAPKVGGFVKGLPGLLKGIPGLGKLGGVLGKGAAGLGKLAGGPLGFIASIAGSMIGDSISGNAAEGKEGTGQRLGGNTLSGAATGAGIGAGIGALFGGIGAVPGAAIGGAIGGAAGFFGSSEEDQAQFFADFGKGWNEFWGVTVPAWWQSLVDGVGGWLEGIGKGWNDFWTITVPKFWTDLGAGITGWLDGIGNGWNTFWTETFPYWLGFAVGATVKWFAGIGTAWNTFWTVTFPAWILSAAAAVTTWIAGIGPAWTTFWAETFPKWYETAKANVSKWVSSIGPAWTNFWTVTFPKWLASGKAQVKRWVDGIGPMWNTFWGKTLPAFGTNLLKEATDFIAGLSKGWDEWWNGVKGAIGSWWGNFWKGFSAGSGDPTGGNHNGGEIKRAGGGGVPGHGNSDTVRAMLTPGEFVIRKGIVDRVGLDNLVKLNAGILSYSDLLRSAASSSRKPKDGGGSLVFNGGGLVPTVGPTNHPGGGRGPDFGNNGGTTNNVSFGDINIYNPVPERASNSLSVKSQQLAHLGLSGGPLE